MFQRINISSFEIPEVLPLLPVSLVDDVLYLELHFAGCEHLAAALVLFILRKDGALYLDAVQP